jgi:hypothetical protein
MIRNLLIAASAVAVLATASATTASAKLHVDLHVGGGYGYGYGYGQPYPYYPVVGPGYYADDDCGFVVKKVKKWNKWHTAYIVKHKKVWVCY